MFKNFFSFINIFIDHIADYFVYICTDLLIKHSVNMKKLHLNVSIRRTKRGCPMPFKLEIDGDVFYCLSYHHSVCTLLQILTRDEL